MKTKALISAIALTVALTAGADNANLDTNTKITTIPLLNINGVTTFKEVKLKLREDGLLELVSLQNFQANNVGIGQWHIDDSKDQVTDARQVFLNLTPISGANYLNDKFNLWIRCYKGNTDLIVDFKTFLSSKNTYVTSRIGTASAESQYWDLSTDNTSVFYPRVYVKDFIKKMFNQNKLVVEISSYSNGTLTGVWDISGIENAIKPVQEACNWQ